MTSESLDLIFNACAAVMMIGFTIIIAAMAVAFLAMLWSLTRPDDQRD